MGQKYFSKLKNIRLERAMGRIQQHFWRDVTAIVVWMIETIPKNGKASHDSLVGCAVLRKSNRKLKVDDIVANWENCGTLYRQGKIMIQEINPLRPRKGIGRSVKSLSGANQPSAKLIKILSAPTSRWATRFL
jgi:hypothetical protein